MIAVALRSMGQRKLRSALTALAILLGVAMIAGTYVQTDQIRTAFDEIEQTAFAGIDVNVQRREGFSGGFTTTREPIPAELVDRLAGVPGVARAEGQLWDMGAPVVRGRTIQPQWAPSMVVSAIGAPFNALVPVRGRMPARSGEIAVNRKLAEDERLRLGEAIGVTTRTGVQRGRLVGVLDYRGGLSMGGATMIVAPLADVQRWFDRQGRVSEIKVDAAPGVSPETLVARVQAALPRSLEAKTGARSATDEAGEINDQLGSFLTPALLAFAGAALLVGAFIIFNTFSITVAQRTREFALLRALGATRGQILAAVATEAAAIGAAASVAGLFAGLGFARLLGWLFDAAGMGIPRSGMDLAPRTVAISLTVGMAVTLLAALVPARRATRVLPVAALRDEAPVVAPRRARWRRAGAVLVALAGVALLVQGLLGGGTATSRLGIMGAGALLVFVGAAASARFVVRPMAALVGWPIERLGHATGRLARENAARNPARTAVTAAALMVGLGLVVFVAVFADGLKGSIDGGIEDRMKAELVVSADTQTPLPPQVGRRIAGLGGTTAVSPQYVDQVEVDGARVNATTDVINGVDPEAFAALYDVEWAGPSADVAALAPGTALVEERFGREHGIAVGERFTIRTSTGHTATLRAVARYRDPMIFQGMIVDARQFAAVSAARDPWFFMIGLAPGAGGAREAKADVKAALAAFPTATVRTAGEYQDYVGGRVDQIVSLLYALLAMSVVISLFGIANSLFLAIHERTREIGMLRAVGATAAQVRRLVGYESVITAVIGGVLGTGIGVLFAWLATFALEDLGVGFSLPVGQLAGFLVLAVVVGVVGAIVPGRRAAGSTSSTPSPPSERQLPRPAPNRSPASAVPARPAEFCVHTCDSAAARPVAVP